MYRAIDRLATTRLSDINLLQLHPQSGALFRLPTPRLGASGGTRLRWVKSNQAHIYSDVDGLEFEGPVGGPPFIQKDLDRHILLALSDILTNIGQSD